MTSKCHVLIERCNQLYNHRVEVDYLFSEKVILPGRVIGWVCDEDEEDEPVAMVKIDACFHTGGSPIEDFFRLDQIRVVESTEYSSGTHWLAQSNNRRVD